MERKNSPYTGFVFRFISYPETQKDITLKAQISTFNLFYICLLKINYIFVKQLVVVYGYQSCICTIFAT